MIEKSPRAQKKDCHGPVHHLNSKMVIALFELPYQHDMPFPRLFFDIRHEKTTIKKDCTYSSFHPGNF